MSDLAAGYAIPPELDLVIDRGFLVLSAEQPAEKSVYFHIPSRRSVDHRQRMTVYCLKWIHPDFNGDFCDCYFETPGDLPNFTMSVETEDVGGDQIDDLETVDDLVCWLVDFSNSGNLDGAMRTDVSPKSLAAEFCRVLDAWLDPGTIAEVNRFIPATRCGCFNRPN